MKYLYAPLALFTVDRRTRQLVPVAIQCGQVPGADIRFARGDVRPVHEAMVKAAGGKNVWIVGNAAYMLRSQYNLTVQRGAPQAEIAALAERYFLKAQALDPSLDREKTLPRLEAVVAKPEVKLDWDAAAQRIRRLPIFPHIRREHDA